MTAIQKAPYLILSTPPDAPDAGKMLLFPVTGRKFQHEDEDGNIWTLSSERPIIDDSGAAYAVDLSLGSSFEITLTADCTFTFINPPSGLVSFTLTLYQDGTGGWVTTLPTVKWGNNGVAPTLTLDPNAIDMLVFRSPNGGTFYLGGAYGTNFA